MDDTFKKHILAMRGDSGKKWLEELPQTIAHYEDIWRIACQPPFQLSYNYVAPATTEQGTRIVLKISFPDNKEFNSEFEALHFFEGKGAIKVLNDDIKNGVMLLENAEPGDRVSGISPDEKQISIVSQVLNQLHKPIDSKTASLFPTLRDWEKAFDRYKDTYPTEGPLPKWMLDKAEGLFGEFLHDDKQKVLLHGDLHNDNILLSDRGWLTIDPKGIIGERAFELGAYLRNPLYDFPKGSEYKKLETTRILQFSEELGFDKQRILGWTFVCAVLSALWFLEDENTLNILYIQNAELLHEITL